MNDNVDQMDIVLREDDFPGAAEISAGQAGELTLGGESEAVKSQVMSAVPSALAKRLKGMLPDGFKVGAIEIEFSVSGKPFGIGVAGKAKVKFVPSA